MKKHFLHYLNDVMAHQWDDPALTDYNEEQEYTFGELAKEMERLHILFQTLGIEKGDKIALAVVTVPIGQSLIWRLSLMELWW